MSTELSSQMQNQNNTLKEELSNNNKQVLESVNTLYKLNDTIEDKITNVSQLVDNTLDNILNVIAKVEVLSSLQLNNSSDTQEKLCNISNNVELIKSIVEPIALYTEQK